VNLDTTATFTALTLVYLSGVKEYTYYVTAYSSAELLFTEAGSHGHCCATITRGLCSTSCGGDKHVRSVVVPQLIGTGPATLGGSCQHEHLRNHDAAARQTRPRSISCKAATQAAKEEQSVFVLDK
jgi:hypothetical protein